MTWHRFASTASAAVLVAACACACGNTAQQTAPAHRSQPTHDAAAESPARVKPDRGRIVRVEGDRVLPFQAPTLVSFASNPLINGAYEGDVTSVTPRVTSDEDVYSDVGLTQADGTLVKFTELGGTVRRGDVSAYAEAKMGKKLTPGQAAQLVTFEYEGVSSAQVGDHIVVLTHQEPGSDVIHGLVRIDRLQSLSGTTYAFPGEAPNASWSPPASASAIASLIKAARK